MGVHWTPSWSSILHLLLHITILQNVWQLFCIHLTARKRKTRSSAKVKEQYNSPVLAPSWQQQTESSSSRRWWSRQPRSGPGRSTLQSAQPLSPLPETSHSERGGLANGENLPCWDCGCWWGPPPPEPNTPIRRSKTLKMYLVEVMMITESWQKLSSFWKCSTGPKNEKWDQRLSLEYSGCVIKAYKTEK